MHLPVADTWLPGYYKPLLSKPSDYLNKEFQQCKSPDSSSRKCRKYSQIWSQPLKFGLHFRWSENFQLYMGDGTNHFWPQTDHHQMNDGVAFSYGEHLETTFNNVFRENDNKGSSGVNLKKPHQTSTNTPTFGTRPSSWPPKAFFCWKWHFLGRTYTSTRPWNSRADKMSTN